MNSQAAEPKRELRVSERLEYLNRRLREAEAQLETKDAELQEV